MKLYFLPTLLLLFVNMALQAQAPCSHAQQHYSAQPRHNAVSSLMQQYDIKHYQFDLHIERTSKFIEGSASITFEVVATQLDTFSIELHPNLAIDSITGAAISSVLRTGNVVNVVPATPLAGATLHTLQFHYRGLPPNTTNNWGDGVVSKSVPQYGAQATFSLSVPYFANHWFPAKQDLNDLIEEVHMNIRTDATNLAVSNGVLVGIDTLAADNQVMYRWHTQYPINYYLISFVVGTYVTYNSQITLETPNAYVTVPLVAYNYNSTSQAQRMAVINDMGVQLMHFSEKFGLYPFAYEKFGTIEVPLSGGMEHQTLVNLSTGYDKYLQAHEMSHQWWGDNVNLASLQNMWLNEGFATYCEYLTAEALYPAEAAAKMQSNHTTGFGAAGRIFNDDTSNFNVIYDYARIYAKGAAVVHNLRYLINNDSLFFAALTNFQATYSGKNVRLADFKNFMTTQTGVNLDHFFDVWYYGYGYPRYKLRWANVGNILTIENTQQTSNAQTPIFRLPIDILVQRNGQPDTLLRVTQINNIDTLTIPNLQGVTGLQLDPANWVLNKVISITQDAALVTAVSAPPPAPALTLHPNPATTHIRVSLGANEPILEISVFDASGQRVICEKHNQGSNSLMVSHLPKGRYQVVVITAQHRYAANFIKVE